MADPLLLLWGDFMEYMTIAETAKKWNLSRRRVQTLCSQDRIPGLQRFGSTWMIPKDAIKPADARIKSGKYISAKRESVNGSFKK